MKILKPVAEAKMKKADSKVSDSTLHDEIKAHADFGNKNSAKENDNEADEKVVIDDDNERIEERNISEAKSSPSRDIASSKNITEK